VSGHLCKELLYSQSVELPGLMPYVCYCGGSGSSLGDTPGGVAFLVVQHPVMQRSAAFIATKCCDWVCRLMSGGQLAAGQRGSRPGGPAAPW
jgi:hypothetical protein